MSVSLLIDPFSSLWDSTGTNLAGTLEFYEAGTSTPLDTYTDSTGAVANANPLSLTGGRATVYGTDGTAYKIILKDSAGSTLKTLDNVNPVTVSDITNNVDGIAALIAVNPVTNSKVYTTGFHSAGDGGAGEFFWDATGDKATHNGGTIIDPDITLDWTNNTTITTWFTAGSGTGVWKRTETAPANIQWFGAIGNGTQDDTLSFQAAIDSVDTLGGGAVFVPNGTFGVTKIIRRDFVSIKGEGRGSEIIALTSAETGLIQIDSGPVRFSHMEDLAIFGSASGSATNTGQWAVYSEAVADGTTTGGEWWSTWKNIRVDRFNNVAWFKGAATGSSLPNQFITMINFSANRDLTTGVTLKLTGMCNQVHTVNAHLDGPAGAGAGAGTNIEVSVDTTNAPANVIFKGLTTQNAEKGAVITGADGVIFYGGWFENLHKAVTYTSGALGGGVKGCHFANAASDGASGGFAVEVSNTASAFFEKNHLLGNVDTVISASTTPRSISAYGNITATPTVATSSGITQQVSVSSNTITLNGNRTALVNTSVDNITTITADDMFPGEIITLKAHSGTVKFATGGNINLSGVTSPITIPSDGTVSFVKFDLTGDWRLVDTSPAAAVTDLNQTITGPDIAEVQVISDKVDELLAALRLSGKMQ